jgi:hypothetical protein
MQVNRAKLRFLKQLPFYPLLAFPRRLASSGQHVLQDVPNWLKWSVTSKEESNFTYHLTPENLLYLAHTLSVVTGCSVELAQTYIREIREDRELAQYVEGQALSSKFRGVTDRRVAYGRRIGWYAMVRILKPKVVIETGVDKGLGAVVLCAALLRNQAEGSAGAYYGTDIVPTAGWMLKAPYNEVGQLLIGDSVESLRGFQSPIDLFVNDSDHSADYEALEYETIVGKLSPKAVILGDNAHVTSKLAEFSLKQGRRFVYFQEEPEHHWYRGGGIGMSYL